MEAGNVIALLMIFYAYGEVISRINIYIYIYLNLDLGFKSVFLLIKAYKLHFVDVSKVGMD